MNVCKVASRIRLPDVSLRLLRVFVVPLFVVPTELTEYTEAYGLVFFEFTERIDAKRHTAECTELIANTPFISVDSCLAKRRPFCGFQKLKSVGFCVFSEFCGNYIFRMNRFRDFFV